MLTTLLPFSFFYPTCLTITPLLIFLTPFNTMQKTFPFWTLRSSYFHLLTLLLPLCILFNHSHLTTQLFLRCLVHLLHLGYLRYLLLLWYFWYLWDLWDGFSCLCFKLSLRAGKTWWLRWLRKSWLLINRSSFLCC